jgi:hypothetical protein
MIGTFLALAIAAVTVASDSSTETVIRAGRVYNVKNLLSAVSGRP